jgi:hypothetical protein
MTGVSADPERIAVILNDLAPTHRKQLRQFIETCGFYSRFIVNNSNYLAPLLQLLKQGNKCVRMDQKQEALLRLREYFTHSIHLVHTRDGPPTPANWV